MRSYLIGVVACIACLYATTVNLHAQQTPDFRAVRWGLRPKEVRETETLKPSSVKREKLTYTGVPLADRTVGLDYDFNGDSLVSASYFLYTTASVTKDDIMAASAEFEALLNAKYGPGKKSLLGDVRNTVWQTPRTQINLSVGNVDRGWSLEVQYLCRVCTEGQPKAPAQTTFKPRKDIKDF
ncbi:hypothetical protein [Spirosoma agri]|uniref:Uncharacterized protein n=1 Tax=Spirosoma agri TaxID=1987381 RepID=A0A6M0ICZ2_9BACT|nr:hypothetical protein [Spirosoma agri]NEU65542.1 hypothetical protein [Spirosoma agri]